MTKKTVKLPWWLHPFRPGSRNSIKRRIVRDTMARDAERLKDIKAGAVTGPTVGLDRAES